MLDDAPNMNWPPPLEPMSEVCVMDEVHAIVFGRPPLLLPAFDDVAIDCMTTATTDSCVSIWPARYAAR